MAKRVCSETVAQATAGELCSHWEDYAAERLYFPGFGRRTFRRLNITGMQNGPDGVNVFEAMRQAGRTKPETTMKYTLLQSERD